MQSRLYVLPPRPGLWDWLRAGVGAGLVLGMAEWAVALPAGGVAIPPELAASVFAIEAFVVGAGSLLVGVVLRLARIHLSRSALVGAVVGPLLFAAVSGEFWERFNPDRISAMIAFSGCITAALFAALAGLVCAHLGDRLERSGIVANTVFVWAAVAAPLAVAERLLHELALPAATVWLAALLLVGAAIPWLGAQVAARRGSQPARSFGWVLGWLVVLAGVMAWSPIAVHWLLYEPDLREIDPGPSNFVVLRLPRAPGDSASALLGSGAVSYELLPEARGARGVLVTRAGNSVASELVAAGYATAAILAGDEPPPELLAAEVDSVPGARQLIEGRLAWLAAVPLLTGPARPLFRSTGLEAAARSSDQIAQQARLWLLDWRTTRSGVPFFLYVDFLRAAPGTERSAAERATEGMEDLLEHLLMLGVEKSTLIVALEQRVNGRAAPVRAIVRTPSAWPGPPPSGRAGRVRASELGQLLVEVARSDGATRIALPGEP